MNQERSLPKGLVRDDVLSHWHHKAAVKLLNSLFNSILGKEVPEHALARFQKDMTALNELRTKVAALSPPP